MDISAIKNDSAIECFAKNCSGLDAPFLFLYLIKKIIVAMTKICPARVNIDSVLLNIRVLASIYYSGSAHPVFSARVPSESSPVSWDESANIHVGYDAMPLSLH